MDKKIQTTTMDRLNPPSAMCLTGNLSENWRKFKQRFELYLTATGAAEKADKVKSSILLTVIGEDCLDIYNNFKFDPADDKQVLEKVLEKFQNYFTPQASTTYERYKFFTHAQKDGQTIENYAKELRTMSRTCKFGDLQESLIRDRIICGIIDNGLREKLLRAADDATLDQTLKTCQAWEATKQHVKEITQDSSGASSESAEVHSVRRGRDGYQQTMGKTQTKPQEESSRTQCSRCGYKHAPRNCPAFGKNCNACGGFNHFQKCCRASRTVRVPNANNTGYNSRSHVHSVEQTNTEETELYVDAVNNNNKCEWIVPLCVNQAILPLKVDTGSAVNIISYEDYKSFTNKKRLLPVAVKLTSYTGGNIPVTGQCLCSVKHKGQNFQVMFMVTRENVQPILGLKDSERLGLVRCVFSINEENSAAVPEQYSDIFRGLGCLPGEYRIHVNEDIPPVVDACRRVPFALRDKLKSELDRMEGLGVICPVEEPTEWVNAFAIAHKRNGNIRLCLDPRNLNKAVRREHYKLPTRAEILASMSDANIFTKLDAASGFWQLCLEKQSSMLTTFATPFGRY